MPSIPVIAFYGRPCSSCSATAPNHSHCYRRHSRRHNSSLCLRAAREFFPVRIPASFRRSEGRKTFPLLIWPVANPGSRRHHSQGPGRSKSLSSFIGHRRHKPVEIVAPHPDQISSRSPSAIINASDVIRRPSSRTCKVTGVSLLRSNRSRKPDR